MANRWRAIVAEVGKDASQKDRKQWKQRWMFEMILFEALKLLVMTGLGSHLESKWLNQGGGNHWQEKFKESGGQNTVVNYQEL